MPEKCRDDAPGPRLPQCRMLFDSAVDKAKDANMKLTWEANDIEGYKVIIPVEVNTKKIKKDDQLKRLKLKGTLRPRPPESMQGKEAKRRRPT